MPVVEILGEIPDPRRYNAQHDLTDILFVAFAAMLCGATHCTEMAIFAEARLELLRQFVPLKEGAPSHDTFSRVFRALDPAAFNTAFQRLMAAFGLQARQDSAGQLAIDGKSLRRAYEKGRAHMPPLVVTVFDCESFLSLAQAVAGAGGEAEAAIAALQLLSLDGRLVSGDALHCHRRLTQTVRERGGHYLLAIKGNQSKLAAEARAALDKAAANPRTAIAETHDEDHDRDEVRRCFVIPFRQSPGKNALVDLVAVARIERWRTVGANTTHEVCAYALSRRITPAEALRAARTHWQIENSLHWQLDVLMAEDQTRSRKDNAPATLAALRRMALNVLRADPAKIPLSHKRLKARWDDQELMRLMTHMR
ncbi:ISAs1 family transposase [Phenylobacterium sp.]|jgi:predicted transposase YbfD/YdcC|uniref:ISAs1 family transposase n=1 Tax=Phenylobacterium sp. TaxID=1871053 RepID=UPI002E353238|nr:ISAs1 family transposase [Phenylobacterium sp.]HEX3364541.1 ISAs1 family transposase [Phenylobacterium sp.]